MPRIILVSLCLTLAPLPGRADPDPVPETKQIAGMSIVGDHESPKALVIVPWKSSALGGSLDVSQIRDELRGPVDREVFRRELGYFHIRSATSGQTAR